MTKYQIEGKNESLLTGTGNGDGVIAIINLVKLDEKNNRTNTRISWSNVSPEEAALYKTGDTYELTFTKVEPTQVEEE
ncbi:hypothetical protein [Paenibacillus xylaniclasticus]|uniref:hypothetical protein n=1 Tax=Paenibacillus xylaniclasticus TaxID=588083 RepID=UPI000FDBEA51|nr:MULTISPECIES: hypothetical protein [Paenibacillus]GFN32426.1 hypothetical protein PCURB6_26860 [Paenibacillus curdlanolyticus]